MIAIREAIVVEGRYDIDKVRKIFDTAVIETRGFGIYKDKEKLQLIRKLAVTCGVILLTDPDGAGFQIRNYLKGAIPEGRVYQALVPDRAGKERRKAAPSKEGLLGVEGLDEELIREAVLSCGICADGVPAPRAGFTKVDFFELGLSGKQNSSELRRRLAARLDLPRRITANGLLEVCDLLLTREELEQAVQACREEDPCTSEL